VHRLNNCFGTRRSKCGNNSRKFGALFETPLEIVSSDNEVKQKFHQILEQLDQFENQIPIRLHHVICKLRTFVERVDVRFVSAQKTIQDYDQLLQSRSLILKKLESIMTRKTNHNQP
jgi:uncharacterized coiled-coil DUF342 family protein